MTSQELKARIATANEQCEQRRNKLFEEAAMCLVRRDRDILVAVREFMGNDVEVLTKPVNAEVQPAEIARTRHHLKAQADTRRSLVKGSRSKSGPHPKINGISPYSLWLFAQFWWDTRDKQFFCYADIMNWGKKNGINISLFTANGNALVWSKHLLINKAAYSKKHRAWYSFGDSTIITEYLKALGDYDKEYNLG